VAVALSLVIILFHLFLNELIEVDKIGSVFFVIMAVLIRCDTWLEEQPAGKPDAYQTKMAQA
jgi:O-antigen ligase